MTCPRCGFEQPERADCARCGIVVARYRPAAMATATDHVATAPAAPAGVPAGTRGRGSRAAIAWGGALAVVVAVVAIVARRAPATPSGTAAAGGQDIPAGLAIPAPAWDAPSPATAATAPGPVVDAREQPPATEPVPAATCPLDSVAPAAAPRLMVSREWLTGSDGHSRAEREQRESGAPMLVYFYTDWCGYCRRLDETLLTTWEVERYLGERIVKVRVNPEEGSTERQLSTGYGVTGYPSLFLVNETSRRSFSPYAQAESGKAELMTPDQLVAALEKDVTRQAQRMVYEAGQSRSAGEAAAAVSLLDKALALRPDDAGTWLRRGIARATAGDADAALGDLRQARDLDAGQIGVYEGIEFALGQQGRWAEAAACWNAYIDREPRMAKAYFHRGGSYFRAGDRKRAMSDAEAACTLGDAQGCEILRRLRG